MKGNVMQMYQFSTSQCYPCLNGMGECCPEEMTPLCPEGAYCVLAPTEGIEATE